MDWLIFLQSKGLSRDFSNTTVQKHQFFGTQLSLYDYWTLLIATGEAIPLRGLEGVPGLPGAPQDEAGLTRKFETQINCGTFQAT